MDTPLEIAFHNLSSSPALEEDIRKRVARLEKLYPRLAGCRVAIEAPLPGIVREDNVRLGAFAVSRAEQPSDRGTADPVHLEEIARDEQHALAADAVDRGAEIARGSRERA